MSRQSREDRLCQPGTSSSIESLNDSFTTGYSNRLHASQTASPTEVSHSEDGRENEDDSHRDDADSAIGSDVGPSTYTASTSTYRFHHENGRRYHAYHERRYIMPNDELEQNKLHLAHIVNYLALDGRLFISPLDTNNIGRVLDVGTGAGEWAIDFAESFPKASILGTDLFPIQPNWVPSNCQFEVEDVDDEWLYEQPFSFIHTRTLCGGIRDWPRFYQICYTHLEPGGWLELQENEARFQRIDGTNPPDTDQFLRLLDQAAILRGCRINVAHEQKAHMLAAGFQDVHEIILRLPLSEWHSDPKMRDIGRISGAAMSLGVEGYSLAMYTRYLGWSKEEVQILLEKVRKDVTDTGNKMYIAEHFISGKKPGGAENMWPRQQFSRPNMPEGMWEVR